MASEKSQTSPEVQHSMERYRRAGFIALGGAGLCALLTLVSAVEFYVWPAGVELILSAGATWLIAVAWYALRHSDELSDKTIKKLDRSATIRLEKMARASEPSGTNDYMYLKTRLDEEQARIDRHGGVMSLLYLELLDLEDIRGQYGAKVQDTIQEETHSLLASQLRQYDALGHLGGNEFLAMLPQTNRREARTVAESVVEALSSFSIQIPGGKVLDSFQIGVGIAAYPLNGET
ncbi:MAG: diguanylate cyclase, partial [Planctomycetes bacterium]|nr:diguanylate cyclase [Planctomycetota bacterium]